MRMIAGWIMVAAMGGPVTATAADAVIQVSLRDHVFTPSEIHIPSGKAVFIEVINNDTTAEEFESGMLGIEKVIPAGSRARIRIHPLAPGRYRFDGEYHEKTAKGAIVADAGN